MLSFNSENLFVDQISFNLDSFLNSQIIAYCFFKYFNIHISPNYYNQATKIQKRKSVTKVLVKLIKLFINLVNKYLIFNLTRQINCTYVKY